MLDGGSGYAQSHVASESDPPFERDTWLKANPIFGFYVPMLESAITREAELARLDPAVLQSFQGAEAESGCLGYFRIAATRC